MNDISFNKIFRVLLLNIYSLILGFFIFTGISSYYYYISDEIYEIRSNLQVFPPAQSALGQEIQLDLLTSNNSPTLSDLVLLYQSRTNFISIIKEFNLNIEPIENDIDKYIFNKISFLENDKSLVFFMSFDNDGFSLLDADENLIGSFNYDQDYYNPNFSLNISKPQNSKRENNYKFVYYDDELLIKRLKKRINVSIISSTNLYTLPKSGLLQTSIKFEDIDEGIKILNFANNIFIEKGIFEQSERARLSILFLDQTIKNIQEKLVFEKDRLNAFQEESKTLNVEFEIQTIISELSELNAQINQLDLRISDNSKIYTSNNPFYESLLKQRQILVAKKDSIEKNISNLPASQQTYIDLFRDVEISERLYAELVNKRLEFQILEASTLGNISISDSAFFFEKVEPQLSVIPLLVIIGMVLLAIFIVVRGVFFAKIINPAELSESKNVVNILGVTPLTEISIENPSKNLENSIEGFITNLFHTIEKKNKETKTKNNLILISSPTASNGKSTQSSLISRKLAQLGHKTLLLDLDMVKGELHKAFDFKRIYKEEFRKLPENIEKYKCADNLYLIPRLRGLESPFELVNSTHFQNILEELKLQFDYVIIDSAPILSVPETSTLVSLCDINILVIRHAFNSLNEFEYANLIINQLGADLDGVIYNMIKANKGIYYGYGYGYGGLYYQYYSEKYLYSKYSYKD